MRSAEFGIKVFCRFMNKMKERSDTTIPHSEIHIPQSYTTNPFISVSPIAYLELVDRPETLSLGFCF